MKKSLRKIAASVSATYLDGGYSNNLAGTDFELERFESRICLSINLSGNLNVRNKAANCYCDANELVEKHASLKSIQIDEHQVIAALRSANQNNPNACWELVLRVGEQGSFRYSIKPKILNGSLFLNVC